MKVRIWTRQGLYMKTACIFIAIALTFALNNHVRPAASADNQTSDEVIQLNNAGVAALDRMYRYRNHRIVGQVPQLAARDYQAVIDKFEAALKVDPKYGMARQNLMIAHNNYALYLASHKHQWAESLQQFHQALYIGQDRTTAAGMSAVIRLLGRNPSSFVDRLRLAEEAKAGNDLIGAVVEYRAALQLRNDPATHKKLGDVYRLLDEKDKAVAEYAAAYRDSN
jgi:tetratricopeptide (TPR) repeat protein